MLTFWALLNKTDIEHYVHSLILPDYMSHLVMEPFRWRNQSRTPDGRTPLIIRYYGPGRIEEIPLSPEVHAERLLGVAKPGIELTKVRLPEDGVFWNWETSDLPEGMAVIDAEEPYDDLEGEWDESDDPTARLRLFFFPKESLLKEELPVNVPSHDAYVSVTREEIFISQRMIQD